MGGQMGPGMMRGGMGSGMAGGPAAIREMEMRNRDGGGRSMHAMDLMGGGMGGMGGMGMAGMGGGMMDMQARRMGMMRGGMGGPGGGPHGMNMSDMSGMRRGEMGGPAMGGMVPGRGPAGMGGPGGPPGSIPGVVGGGGGDMGMGGSRPHPAGDLMPGAARSRQGSEVPRPTIGEMASLGAGGVAGAAMMIPDREGETNEAHMRRSRHEIYPGLPPEIAKDCHRAIRRAERYANRGPRGAERADDYSFIAGKLLFNAGMTPDLYGGMYALYLDKFMQMQTRMAPEDGENMLDRFLKGEMLTGKSRRSKLGLIFSGRDGAPPRRSRRPGYRSDSSDTTSSSGASRSRSRVNSSHG